MQNHEQLAALIRAAEKYFRLEPGTLRAPEGRYLPLTTFRQITQLVAYERGFTKYAIGKAFSYNTPDFNTSVRRNVARAKVHLERGQSWWFYTKAGLVDAWDEELEGA